MTSDFAYEFALEAQSCGHDITKLDVLDILASLGLVLIPGDSVVDYFGELG